MKSSLLSLLFLLSVSLNANTLDNSNPWVLENLNIGQIVELEDIHFEMDKSILSKESKKSLLSLRDFLNENKSVVIELRGHTNTIPPDSYCDKLSQSRAQSVKDYLVSIGTNQESLTAKGYGKRVPVALTKNRKSNQRVEFKILAK